MILSISSHTYLEATLVSSLLKYRDDVSDAKELLLSECVPILLKRPGPLNKDDI